MLILWYPLKINIFTTVSSLDDAFLVKKHSFSELRSGKKYRAGPLMVAIIFMSGTKYDCNDSYYGN